jgi:hypothetical protein
MKVFQLNGYAVRKQFLTCCNYHTVSILLRRAGTVEYHAIVESCSDKFHVDIPNVVGARGRCTCRVRTARSLTVFPSDRSERLSSPSERKKN